MKKSIKLSLLLLITLVLFTCYIFFRKSDAIVGTWIQSSRGKGVVEYNRNYFFDNQLPGIDFIRNGDLIIRQNSSYCGTPPISYSNFEGTWKRTSDSTIVLNYQIKKRGNRSGEIEEEFLIVNKVNHKLIIKTLSYSNKKTVN